MKRYKQLPEGFKKVTSGKCKKGDLIKHGNVPWYVSAFGLIGNNVASASYYKVYRKYTKNIAALNRCLCDWVKYHGKYRRRWSKKCKIHKQ